MSLKRDDASTTTAMKLRAKKEIGEAGIDIHEKLNNLKQVLEENHGEPRLPPTFDYFLLRCLRVRKFDVARSAKLVSQYFKLMGDLSDMHSCLMPSQYLDLYKTHATGVFKHRDAEGRAVILTRQELVSPSIYSFDEALAATLLLLDEVVKCSVDTQRQWVVFICDWKGYSLAHLTQTSPSRLRTAAKLFQDAFPARFKAFHFVRNPFLVSCMFAIVKPFLRQKIKNRVFFHGHDLSSFHKHISPDILPEFLGGILPNDKYADDILTQRLLRQDAYYQAFAIFNVLFCRSISSQPQVT